jgi:hypothetical protein
MYYISKICGFYFCSVEAPGRPSRSVTLKPGPDTKFETPISIKIANDNTATLEIKKKCLAHHEL